MLLLLMSLCCLLEGIVVVFAEGCCFRCFVFFFCFLLFCSKFSLFILSGVFMVMKLFVCWLFVLFSCVLFGVLHWYAL